MLDENSMRCPYCKRMFWVTEEEQYDNEIFECPHCHQVNAGCIETDEYGVLLGVSILDYELQEISRDKWGIDKL